MMTFYLILVLGSLWIFWGLTENVLQNGSKSKDKIIFRVIPYTPRKTVPWNGWEFIMFLFGSFILFLFVLVVVNHIPFDKLFPERILEESLEKRLMQEHSITQFMIRGRDTPGIFVIAFLAGTIIIPIGEEFLFRLLFQGYLEKRESFFRKCFSFLFHSPIVRGLAPILISSTIFAALHFRETTKTVDYRMILDGMITYIIAYPLWIFMTVSYLIVVRRATLIDLGIDVKKIPQDIKITLLTALCVFPPVYALNFGLGELLTRLPLKFAIDPIPLFFLAAALGFVYYRTHRVLPCVFVHCVFNFISLALVCRVAYTW